MPDTAPHAAASADPNRQTHRAARCEKRCKGWPTPEGMSPESAALHPSYASRLEPGAQCELDAGHDEEPHRNGGLIWHDPPVLFVDGKRYTPGGC